MNAVTESERSRYVDIHKFMVLSLYYQALPDNCRLLAKARRDVAFGSYLEKCIYVREIATLKVSGISEDPMFDDFIAEVRNLVEENPWIEERNLNLGKNWDVLHFLMSEKRRGQHTTGHNDWIGRAINGGDDVIAGLKTSSGISIKYLGPSEVAHISQQLSATSLETLSDHWDPAKMKESDVHRPDVQDEDQYFDDICRDLKRLQTFYTVVSKYGEGIVTLAV